jgi:methylmalonyl-CoA mutase
MLRATTEAMAAVIGGTDSLAVVPFDRFYKRTDDFSERIAKNIQLVLKEEAHFDKVKDPAAGSYYIEHLTQVIAEKSWEIFLNVQENGGFIEAFKKGIIQEDIDKTAKIRSQNIANRKEVFVGCTQYPNSDEIMKDIDFNYSFSKEPEVGNLGRALRLHRATEEVEKMRLATDYSPKRPVVFNLTIGDLTFRKARAQFSSGFFACAGFKIIDNLGFDSIKDGLKEAETKDADIIVLCSSDDEYESLAKEITELAKDKIIVVAGNPKCRQQLEDAGIKHFIHVKSNLLEELSGYQKLLGIKPIN